MLLWNGRKLKTYGDIGSAMCEIAAIPDEAERRQRAAEFMRLYQAETPYAYQNVGYLAGYYGDMASLLELFQTAHPIFGRNAPTQEEALATGRQLGEYIKAGRERE